MKAVKFLLVSLLTLVLIGVWGVIAVFMSFDGWWIKPIAPEGDTEEFFTEAKTIIDDSLSGEGAIILIEDGSVAQSYLIDVSTERGTDKIFPTASFSKWIAALAVMELVENGKIDLDKPVSNYLTRWQLPESEYSANDITVRQLLSHTAGLMDGLGFGDYTAEEMIPSLEESLENPRASSGENVVISVGQEPGTFLYSGGGYLILELIVEEVSERPYADYVHEAILDPLGMTHSGFDYLGSNPAASGNFDAEGNAVPHFQYASAAATGFSTSAHDLTLLVTSILEGTDFPLTSDSLSQMREVEATVMGLGIWGLGTILYGQAGDGDYVFGHDGVNDPAINVSVRINPQTNDAYIMLVTGHQTLASNLGSEWVLWQTGAPDILSTDRALKSALLPAAIGGGVILLLVILFSRRRRKK